MQLEQRTLKVMIDKIKILNRSIEEITERSYKINTKDVLNFIIQRIIEKDELRKAVLTIIHKAKRLKYFDTFKLYFIEQMTAEDISNMMGISIRTVFRRLEYIRANI